MNYMKYMNIFMSPFLSTAPYKTLNRLKIRVGTLLPLDFYSLSDVPLCPPPFPPLTVTNQNV